MKYLLLLAALVCGTASAGLPDMLFDNGNVSIRLTPAPCAIPEIAEVLSNVSAGPSFAALVTFQGRNIAACWVFAPGQNIVLVDEDGDGGTAPMGAFKPVE